MKDASGITVEGVWDSGALDVARVSGPDVVYTAEVNAKYQAHGEGCAKLVASGVTIEGSFKNGAVCGHDVVKLDDGTLVYKGSFMESTYHGDGVLHYLDGSKARFEGHMKRGYPHGKGKLKVGLQIRYEGEWKKGKPHGEGVVITREGNRARCLFDKGKLVRTLQFPPVPDSSGEESHSQTEELNVTNVSFDISSDAEVGTPFNNN